MRFKFFFFIVLLLAIKPERSKAQSVRHAIALPYTTLSAYSALQNDPLSFTSNQASLAHVKQAGIGVYGERRFLLAENNCYNLAAVIPAKMSGFGLQISYSGFKNFNESKLGLAYGRKLGRMIDIGIQFNYYGYHIPTYDNGSTVNAEAGAIIHFTNKLIVGIHMYNPVAAKLSKYEESKLASVYKLGLGYDASESLLISGEIVKEEDKPVNVIAGFQYRFAGQFFARTGFRSESSTVFTGAGVAWKNWRIDVAGSYHPQLGLSPGILFIAYFGNKEKES
jgi:hypothetical protein